MAFYFAKAFEDLGGDPSDPEFMDTVRELAYAFMLMGVVIFFAQTAQNTFMELAAAEMTHCLKTAWFEALLRQDMAYFDIVDVTGEASIISVNGAKYRRTYILW